MVTVLVRSRPSRAEGQAAAAGAGQGDVAGDVHGVGQGAAAPPSCKVPPLRFSVPLPNGPEASMPPETVLLAPICKTPPARLLPPLYVLPAMFMASVPLPSLTQRHAAGDVPVPENV